MTYDTDKDKMIVAHTQYAGVGAGQGTHVFTFNDTFDSNVSATFVGFADGSYSNGQEVKVHGHQATNSAQSGLTTNSVFTSNITGNLSTTPDIVAIKAGTASVINSYQSTTNLVMITLIRPILFRFSTLKRLNVLSSTFLGNWLNNLTTLWMTKQ